MSESHPPSDSAYRVKVVRRDGDAMVADDWHATITRVSDGKEAVSIAAWRWLLLWRIRRAALDRLFRWMDARDRKLAEVQELVR